MKARRLVVAPQARRDLEAIVLWYRREVGVAAAAKAARSIHAGIRAAAQIDLATARRHDLPDGFFRIVARAHLVVFRVEADVAQIVRILHGARDIAALLENDKE